MLIHGIVGGGDPLRQAVTTNDVYAGEVGERLRYLNQVERTVERLVQHSADRDASVLLATAHNSVVDCPVVIVVSPAIIPVVVQVKDVTSLGGLRQFRVEVHRT